MKKETCGQRVVAVSLERCQTTKYCNTGCESRREFVCGSDNKFYRNVRKDMTYLMLVIMIQLNN